MAEQSELAARMTGWLDQARDAARVGIPSPAAWSVAGCNALKCLHRVVGCKGAVPQGAP